jgi:hypothetical protein
MRAFSLVVLATRSRPNLAVLVTLKNKLKVNLSSFQLLRVTGFDCKLPELVKTGVRRQSRCRIADQSESVRPCLETNRLIP